MKNRKKSSLLLFGVPLVMGLLLLPRRSKSSVPTGSASAGTGGNSPQSNQAQTILANLKPLERYGKNVPKYWLAVAAFESGNFQNKLTKQASNPFAMTKVAQRPTTQKKGETITAENGASFGVYPSLADAAKDIVLYMDYFSKYGNKQYKTLYSLIADMKRSPFPYFSAPLPAYFAGVNSQYKKLFPSETDSV